MVPSMSEELPPPSPVPLPLPPKKPRAKRSKIIKAWPATKPKIVFNAKAEAQRVTEEMLDKLKVLALTGQGIAQFQALNKMLEIADVGSQQAPDAVIEIKWCEIISKDDEIQALQA